MSHNLSQIILDKLFDDNPSILINHHLDSFNEFFRDGIKRIFKEKNPIRIMKEQDRDTGRFHSRCNIFLAGKDGDKLYYGKPIIFDEQREHFMYPNEARLRNMTYGITIHYDVLLEFYITPPDGDYPVEPTYVTTLPKIFLGRFPIMLGSDLCILKNMVPDMRYELGECKNEYGGYFIIDGKEKVIVSQEKFADNMLYVRDKVNEIYSHSADIRSVSEDASKPIRTLSVRILAPSDKYTNQQIVVLLPNVRKPVPLFIVMRALGIVSDKSILEYCVLDMNKYKSYLPLFIPCIHDSGMIFSQEQALKYIATFTKHKTVSHALEILTNYFLPHIGEMNFIAKAYYLGHMVRELLRVYTKDTKATDRDNYKYKRVELPGSLLYDLFKEYMNLQQKNIYQRIDKEYTYKQGLYKTNFTGLIEQNYRDIFSERMIETGFRKGFKGNWGSDTQTSRLGIVQTLNRLSYNSALSHLRKINLPLDASAKVVGPRLLHGTQWGVIDPFDTPDGANVGLHKHLSLATSITTNVSSKALIEWLMQFGIHKLEEHSPFYNGTMTKIIVNGNWIGVYDKAKSIVDTMKQYRRNGLIPYFTSVQWDISNQTIYIYTDAGRLCRPLFYVTDGQASFENASIHEKIESNQFTWEELKIGFAKRKLPYNPTKVYTLNEMYNTEDITKLDSSKGVVEYMDTAEAECSLIAFLDDDYKSKPYTHIEIHPSLLLGIMGNQIVFPENNPLPRNVFACGQMRQAVSLYHSNYHTRIDKMGVVLNYGQIPLVKSRYLDKINREEHPYGENVIVAIMCYNGYNVEDSILFNQSSIDRGLFRTTYYNMYESHEESSSTASSTIDSHFTKIDLNSVVGVRNGFDYSKLDASGLIHENTPLDDKTILIGKVITSQDKKGEYMDASIVPKKGQNGFVDKSFMTEGNNGFRIAKIRVRDERIPNIGDKFCSRCGQKGTIGLVIPEANMPFTKEGIRPDIIINPHALPSRMTIGQLIETLMGKACVMYGGFGDCTAFMNKGEKASRFGNMLTHVGFHSSGNQYLYNGETGERMSSEIFMGPTYYMRLKHMVKDKINYRSKGPRTILTRQTVQGRANDGGLRIGEMERDGVIAHGAMHFLQESMLVRGDQFYMAVCNKTGMTAIYNESRNLFLSPISDGPIRFSGTLDGGMNVENISKFGKSFSIIRVPYAFKLLMQELSTINVQLRLITDDNIDQLMSMSFSDNIVKISGTDNPESVSQEIQRNQRKELLQLPMEEPLQVNTHKPPMELGWQFDTSDPQTGDIYRSLLINKEGKPTARWWVDDNDYLPPLEHPLGWIDSDLVLPDGTVLSDQTVIANLISDQSPDNWNRIIEKLNPEKDLTYIPNSPLNVTSDSPPYIVGQDTPIDTLPLNVTPDSPVYRPASPLNITPDSPVYRPASPLNITPDSPVYRPASPLNVTPDSPVYRPASPLNVTPDSPPYTVGQDTPIDTLPLTEPTESIQLDITELPTNPVEPSLLFNTQVTSSSEPDASDIKTVTIKP